MSDPISIDIDPRGQKLMENLAGFPDEMQQAIVRGLDKGGNLLLGRITRARFTGQGPFPVSEHRLGVKTNRLRSSLRWVPATIEGTEVTAGMGSNVEYFGAHEFGFSGTVQVRSFTRRVSASQFSSKANQVDVSKIKGKQARAAALGTETVRAHSRVMNVPARAPMTTGITENAEIFSREITKELAAAWGALDQ